MEAATPKVLCFTLVFITLIASGSAIRCFQCWTKEEVMCGHAATLGNDPDDCGPKENVCKKIVTNFYKMEKRGQTAVYALLSNVTSRLCGRSDNRGCFEKQGASSRTIECFCDEDGCNHSQRHLAAMSTTIFLVILAWMGASHH